MGVSVAPAAGFLPGMMMEYGGASAPDGWLVCDGAAVSRTTYATLFDVLGIAYGAGDGSTTFNLPNRKGRVGVGRDAAQTEFDTLGETGGSKTGTQAHSHAHTHGALADSSGLPSATNTGWPSSTNTGPQLQNHSHVYRRTGGGNIGLVSGSNQYNLNFNDQFTGGDSGQHHHSMQNHVHGMSSHTHTVNHTHAQDSTQAGTASGNLVPYEVCNVIIKY